MANISGILEKIREAIYGKEVRGSLADGLEAINNETIAATNLSNRTKERQDLLDNKFDEQIKNMTLQYPSSAEIVDARIKEDGTTFETLGKRINSIDLSLGEKSNIIVCEEIPSVKKENTFYFKVTEKQSASGGNENIKVSPNMGIKIV